MRSPLYWQLLIASSLLSTTLAQSPVALTPEKMPSALRHAGIYHVATGVWTRTGGPQANFGSVVVYSNTAQSGYFNSAGGAGGFAPLSENFDEGGFPGPTNGNPFAGTAGASEASISCIQIGYCDLGAAGSSGWTLNFYNSYTPCTVDSTPDDSETVGGLPANGGCWIVDLDLTGAEICLECDGGPDFPDWDNDNTLDSFGWSYTYAGTDGAAGNLAGFLLCGNPEVTDPTFISGGDPLDGSNTFYGSTNCAGVGTGYITQDFWWLEDPAGVSSNCYFFGGYSNNNGLCTGPSNPFASWWIQLGSEASVGGPFPRPCFESSFGVTYCNSNPNSTGSTSNNVLKRSPRAADDDCEIVTMNVPVGAVGFFIVSETQGFVPNPAGSQGNLCVLGSIGRFVGPGQIKFADAAGMITLSTAAGEWSLTSMPTASGTRSSIAGTTDNFQLWHRDSIAGVATSNFSDGITHTWL